MIYTKFDFNDTGKLKIHGRCSKNNGSLVMSWCNTGFEFNFSGSGFIVNFGKYTDTLPAYLRVIVDGTPLRYALVNGSEKILVDYLDEGSHNVKILRTSDGLCFVTAESVLLRGDSPYLLPPPPEKKLKIEFYGDSITSGDGVIGCPYTKSYTTYEQDSTNTYAYLTAQLLDADGRYMSQSGRGIVSNFAGDRSEIKVSDFWAWENTAGKPYDTSLWTPDVCVLNCGTNDAWGGISDDEFTEKGVEFLGNIRKAYPNAKIIWLFGMMDQTKLGAVEKAVTLFSETDANTYFLPVSSINDNPSEVGGTGHPGMLASKRVSAILVNKIKEIL